MKIFISIFILLLTFTAVGAFELEGGRAFGMGGNVLLSDPTAADFINCPAASLRNARLLFESGFLRRYNLADLDLAYAATAVALRPITFGLSFSQLGRGDYYTERLIKGSLGVRYWKLTLGLTLGSQEIEIGRDLGKYNMVSAGTVIGVHLGKLHLAGMADNLNRPVPEAGAESLRPSFAIQSELEGPKIYTVALRMVWEEREKPQVALAQLVHIGDHSLFWGITGNPVTYGGGLSMYYKGFSIEYSARYHPVLDMSHGIDLKYAWGK